MASGSWGSWGGRRPSLADYVTVAGLTDGRPPPECVRVAEHVEPSRVGRPLAQRLESGDLGTKLVPNADAQSRIVGTCRHAGGSSDRSLGFLLILLSRLRRGIRNQWVSGLASFAGGVGATMLLPNSDERGHTTATMTHSWSPCSCGLGSSEGRSGCSGSLLLSKECAGSSPARLTKSFRVLTAHHG